MAVKEGIIQILNDSQSSLHNHQKLLRKLKALYEQHQNVEDFFETFFLSFTNALVVYKREPAVERVIDFVAKFAISTAPTEKQGSDTCSESGEGGGESEEEEETEITFFSLLVDKLLSIHQARDKAVRFRVCQLVAKMMSYAADAQTKIGPDRLDRVQEVMMQRLYDKIPVVRCHAAASLEYFQDPSPQCPVITALLELMEKDSSPDVRRTILGKIAVLNRTLSAVIERTRDVKEVIRREAFLWLANKCSIRHLTIEERIQVLNDGLSDHSEVVQEACVNGLLRNWSLESMNGDFITLLSRLDVESSQQVVELALTKLFDNFSMEELTSSMAQLMVSVNTKPEVWGEETPERTPTGQQRPAITPSKSVYGGPVGDDSFNSTTATPKAVPPAPTVKLIPLELLRCEEAFYWRCLCHYLHGKGVKGDEWLENIVPTVTEMCDYIERYVREVLLVQEDMESSLQCQFVVQQLCSTLAVMDSSDEAGRRRIAKLMCELLTLSRLPASLVEHLLAEQTKIWPQETFRIEKLTEVIAELRHPSSLSQPTSSNPVAESTRIPLPSSTTTTTPFSSDDTPGSQSLATTILPLLGGGEDSQMSANISVLELRDDADTLYKCLCIACEMLKELQMRKLSPTLQMLVDTLLIPCIQNENPYVRDMALFCLGLACIVDLHMSRKHLLLFLQVSQVDHESVQATALKVVFDLLHIYGFEAFNIGKPGEPASAAKTTSSPDQNEGEVDVSGGDSGAPVEGPGTVEEGGGDGGDGGEAGGQGEEDDSDKNDETTQRILNIMANFLEGESTLLREVAGQGIAKLLLSGRIMSRKLLAKLLVLWYNPITQEEATLRNTLGTFFPAFAAADRHHREFLGEVYLPVIKTLLEAPPTSPLTDIDVGNVADFIIQLTKPTGPSEDSVHDSLAVAVANEVLSDTDTIDVRLYCRSLSTMELTPTNQSNAADLLVLWEKMCQEVKDRTSWRYLDKFGALLKKIKPDYISQEPAAAVAEGGANSPVATTTAVSAKESTTASSVKPKRTRGKSTGAKPRAKTTGKKQTAAAVRTARTGQRQATQRKTRRRGVRFEQDDSSEESDENFDPDEIADLPKRVTSVRSSKRVASRRIVEDGVRAALAYSEEEEEGKESDDSLVGEHSPFVKHSRSKRTNIAEPLKPLQYSEEPN